MSDLLGSKVARRCVLGEETTLYESYCPTIYLLKTQPKPLSNDTKVSEEANG